MGIKKQNNKGFTIIEVVLVLAIAGLIFLMVFIALPALQSSQRDTARKNDAAIVLSAINSYVSNNRGTLPTTAAQIDTYVTNRSSSTLAGAAGFNVAAAYVATVTPVDGVINIIPRAICGTGSGAVQNLTAGSNSNYSVVVRLEAGSGTPFCQNN